MVKDGNLEEVLVHFFLTLGPRDEQNTCSSNHFTVRERAPGAH